MTNELCKCGHKDFNHSPTIGCYANKCPCKKFEPQNQSQETKREYDSAQGVNHLGDGKATRLMHDKNPDTRKGIFDTTDLEKEIEKSKKDNGINEDNIDEFISKALDKYNLIDRLFWGHSIRCIKRKIKLEERTRLRAEVEKILDEWWTDHNHRRKNGLGFMQTECLENLKKRLGI